MAEKCATFEPFAVPCCSNYTNDNCLCAAVDGAERVLRHVIHTKGDLTQAQRDYCRQEIGSIEGYTESDCDGLNDADLARLTLNAWVDYCRDKGLL